MKKITCIFLIFIMTLLSTNIAILAKNEDTPPYSLPYLKNIDGVEYVKYESMEDTTTEEGRTENMTLEMYDVFRLSILYQNWEKTIKPFRDAFKSAGFEESTDNRKGGDVRYVYKKIMNDSLVQCFMILGENESEEIMNEGGLVYILHGLLHLSEEYADKMTKENLDTLIVCSENGNISISLNNNIIEFDTKPQIINGRTMVPLRAIFEALGAAVDWNEKKQMITATRNETTIKLTINNATMHVNDNAITLDSPACLVDGRTLVPVRAISEAFEIQVEWKEIKPTTPIVYDDLSANVNQINDMISKGLYIEAMQECEQTIAWHVCSPDDIELLNSLKASANEKYNAYLKAENDKKTLANAGVSLNQNDINISLKVPKVGMNNTYAYVNVTNNSSLPLIFGSLASINGSGVFRENWKKGDVSVVSGQTVRLKYDNLNTYLDKTCGGYVVFRWNGEQYYAEFDVNGITMFYKGNANGPAQ